MLVDYSFYTSIVLQIHTPAWSVKLKWLPCIYTFTPLLLADFVNFIVIDTMRLVNYQKVTKILPACHCSAAMKIHLRKHIQHFITS